jgi:hypothetical protein
MLKPLVVVAGAAGATAGAVGVDERDSVFVMSSG